jgi:hypothetical protein
MTTPPNTLQIATHLVTTTAFGSPSMLVRVLRQQHGIETTFQGAQELLDRMQQFGIVGPANGSKARDVLMTPERAATALASRRPEAAILRWAAARLRDDHGESTAAERLDNWADQIHPA